jgi:hypothetical protein
MKRSICVVIIILLFGPIVLSQDVIKTKVEAHKSLMEKTDWNAFSKNLVMALKSGNLGLQTSAMQHIIVYHQRLKVSGAITHLVKLYRNHENEQVRQMALVTINKINNDWAKGIVKRDLAFEESIRMKKMMYAILMSKN